MTTSSTWKKRTVPRESVGGARVGSFLRASQASIETREPAGLAAIASISTGESLLTVKAASRSERATKASVAAKISAALRVRHPSATATPETTIATAIHHAAQVGSGGT